MRIGVVVTVLAAVAGVFGFSPQANAQAAERRIALVIGNAAYGGGAALKNPVNDARAMGRKLKALGFDVITVENGTQQQMQRAIAQFSQKLQPDAVSLFFYAGHGIQVNGHNYLVPIGAQVEAEQTVRLETVDVDAVLDQMAMAHSRINMVILDACRNNPFERRFRGQSGGLASIDAPTGTLIAYATSPGKTAADGTGANGLYTAELLRALDAPGLKIEDVFKRVRARVTEQSGGAQTPWEASSLTGDFYFYGPTTVNVNVAPADPDVVFWQSIATSTRRSDFEAYLAQFPQGVFAPLARRQLADLSPAPVAGAATAPTPGVGAARGFEGKWQGRSESWAIDGEVRDGVFRGRIAACHNARTDKWDGGGPRFEGRIDEKGNFTATSQPKEHWADRQLAGRWPELTIRSVYEGRKNCLDGSVTLSRVP